MLFKTWYLSLHFNTYLVLCNTKSGKTRRKSSNEHISSVPRKNCNQNYVFQQRVWEVSSFSTRSPYTEFGNSHSFEKFTKAWDGKQVPCIWLAYYWLLILRIHNFLTYSLHLEFCISRYLLLKKEYSFKLII